MQNPQYIGAKSLVSALQVLTPDACKKLAALAAKALPPETLIARAGWCVARALMSRFTPRRVLFLCGPGNRGRIGLHAAELLARHGWVVRVAFTHNPQAASRFRAMGGMVVPMILPEVEAADLVVDSILGAGVSCPLDEKIMRLLRAASARVAVDIPTGVEGASGKTFGEELDYLMTVTFARLKPAHLLYPARGRMGIIICGDIGLDNELLKSRETKIYHNGPALWPLPTMAAGGHKYKRGVISLCGGAAMPGATLLAADAARLSGAGLVRIAAFGAASLFKQLAPHGVIVDDAPLNDLLEDDRRKVWVCGPGLTPGEVNKTFRTLVAARRQIVADAGVLAWAKGKPSRLKGATVITPHEGEFVGLCGTLPDDRIGAVRALACELQLVVVLKGPSTLIAAPDGRVAINTHASAKLATAGSGDILSGVIAALLANGMEQWTASCAAVWIHGDAGCRAGPWPVVEEFTRHLGAARESAERDLLNL